MQHEFSKDFLFGTSASGPQTEGATNIDGKAPTIWDHWFSIEPQKFHNGIGPAVTSDVYFRYKEDVAMMKQIGLKSHRTSIQWARLMPDGKNVNPKAVEFYRSFIDELLKNDIIPMINLFHFDMPLWLQNEGGFENPAYIEHFANYAKTVFELFGDKVKYFTTFNEPIVVVEGGYLYQFHYRLEKSMKKAVQVAFHTQIASAKAVEIYHSMNLPGKIGIVLNLTPSYPKDDTEENVKAANYADLFFNRSFLDPSIKGEYPEELIEALRELNVMPKDYPGGLELIKNNTIDFLGVNYYQPRRIMARTKPYEGVDPMPDIYFENYEMPGRKMNVYRGWEIYEKGIYDIAINLRDNYGNIAWYVSENGMGVEGEERFINADGRIDDDYRIDFIKGHLHYLHKGIQEGSNCFAYHNWAFVDNWSWSNAYKNRYGYVALDLKTQKRTFKKSAYFVQELIKNNGFGEYEE